MFTTKGRESTHPEQAGFHYAEYGPLAILYLEGSEDSEPEEFIKYVNLVYSIQKDKVGILGSDFGGDKGEYEFSVLIRAFDIERITNLAKMNGYTVQDHEIVINSREYGDQTNRVRIHKVGNRWTVE